MGLERRLGIAKKGFQKFPCLQRKGAGLADIIVSGLRGGEDSKVIYLKRSERGYHIGTKM